MNRLAPYRVTLVLRYEGVQPAPTGEATRYFDSTGEPAEMGQHGTSR
ncbi:hypothetical protein [Streptomyces sp. NPDC000880]